MKTTAMQAQDYLFNAGYNFGDDNVCEYISEDMLKVWLNNELNLVNAKIEKIKPSTEELKWQFDYGYDLGVVAGMLEVSNEK